MPQSPLSPEDTGWDTMTRALHWGLAITVTFQLFSSLMMADTPTQFLYPVHEVVGLIAGAFTIIFWIHAFANGDLGILLPWNRAGITAIMRDLRGLLRGRLPMMGDKVGLSGFIHGLGLLALTGSGASGLILFTLTPLGSHAIPANAIEFTNMSLYHKFLGELFWAYFIGHITFAVLHQLKGAHILGGIFGFTNAASSDDHADNAPEK